MSKPKASKRPWRKNVLFLVSAGYATVLFVFSLLAAGDLTAAQAYDAVQGPLMALIGGSLAIAKDLIQLDQTDDLAGTAHGPDDDDDSGGDGGNSQGDGEGEA